MLIQEFHKSGKKAELVKFPDRTTEIGKLINEYLVNKDFQLPKESIHLLFSANRWEVRDKLLQKLSQNVNLIMDRYYYSGIAYSAANGLDFQWCVNPDIGLPKPDLTLFLTFRDNENVSRLSVRENYGEERYEKVEFQLKVKQQFEKFFNKEEQQRVSGPSTFEIVYVDNKSIKEVQQSILTLTKDYIENENTNPIELFE